MGADCCNESKMDAPLVQAPSATINVNSMSDADPEPVKIVAVAQKDLPSVSLENKDVYEKFELSLPFCRTLVKTFETNV